MAAESPVSEERRNGLSTALNVVVSPAEAFETLRVVPMWGWAFLIASVLAIVGAYLALPAQQHAQAAFTAHMYATDPRFAQMTDADKARMASINATAAKIGPLITPVILLFVGLISTLVLLLVNAIGRGKGTFKTIWAGAINISIVTFGLYQIVVGLLAVVRGADAYNKPLDSLLAMPSLAWIVPGVTGKTAQFLTGFNPFTIWGAVLTFLLLTVLCRMPKGPAYAGSAALLVVGALFLMLIPT